MYTYNIEWDSVVAVQRVSDRRSGVGRSILILAWDRVVGVRECLREWVVELDNYNEVRLGCAIVVVGEKRVL